MAIIVSPQIFMKIVMIMAGLYSWDVMMTLDVEKDLILRRKEFKWPLFFYLANRYSYFGSLLSAAVLNGGSPFHPVNCQRLFASALIFASLAMGLSSTNLAIRTVAIWNRNVFITTTLGVAVCVHWLLIGLHQRVVRAKFEMGKGCVVEEQGFYYIVALLSHCLIFDTLVLALNAWRLARDARLLIRLNSLSDRRTVTQIVFIQGLTYFVFACFCHLVTIVFLLIGGDLGGLFLIVDEGLISIIACRAVRSLHNFTPSSATTIDTSSSATLSVSGPSRFSRSASKFGKSHPQESIQLSPITPNFQTEVVVQIEHLDDRVSDRK